MLISIDLKNFRLIFFGVLFIIIFCRCQKSSQEQIIPSALIKHKGVHINSEEIINGYTDKQSYFNTDTISVYINSKNSIDYAEVKLFSINGRLIDSVQANIRPQKISGSNPWENGFGYKISLKYLPKKLDSGIYFWENKIPIIIKSNQQKKITIVYPSNTENAYCSSGGLSTYSKPVPATKVSFLRPILFSTFAGPFLKWVNQTNYSQDINYIADIDLDNDTILSNTQLLIIPGHNEYWTRQARLNFDKFIDSGNDALVLSGNTMWWQIRYNDLKNQLICFKKNELDNIEDEELRTINWYEDCLHFPILNSIGCDFRYGGYGLNKDSGWDGFKICTNTTPILQNTNLKKGDILSIPTSEYDGTLIQKFDPNGFPIPDNSQLKFLNLEIIGFDFGYRDKQTCSTFIAMQKTSRSGRIINVASTDWCSSKGIGGKDGDKIKTITTNMIDLLLNKQNIFSK